MAPTRRLDAAVRAEVAADLHGIPHARISERNGHAEVFVNGLREVERWFLALGGYFTCDPAPAGSGVVMWTLTTNTDHGHGDPVYVYTLAPDTDEIDPDCAHAVRPHTPAA